MAIDDRVVEAAAKAILTEFGEVPYYRAMADSAITAAMRELAPDIRAAVDAYGYAVCRNQEALMRSGDYGNLTKRQRDQWMRARDITQAKREAARRDLFALLGIEEDTP